MGGCIGAEKVQRWLSGLGALGVEHHYINLFRYNVISFVNGSVSGCGYKCLGVGV